MSSPLSRPMPLECQGQGPALQGSCEPLVLVTVPPGLWPSLCFPLLPLYITVNSVTKHTVCLSYSSELRVQKGSPWPKCRCGRAGPFWAPRRTCSLPPPAEVAPQSFVGGPLHAHVGTLGQSPSGCPPLWFSLQQGRKDNPDDLPYGRSAEE